MKKETRKKIVNISIGTVLSVAAVSPIVIAICKNIANNKGLSQLDSAPRVPGPEFIYEDSAIGMKDYKKIFRAKTSNGAIKAIPTGFVGHTDERVFAFDRQGNVLWYDTSEVPTGLQIVSIEYNSKYDDLIVLYSINPGNIREGFSLYTKVFSLATLLKGGVKPHHTRYIVKNSYDGHYNSWGISPIYEMDGASDSYVIYNKYFRGNPYEGYQDTQFYRIKRQPNGDYWWDGNQANRYVKFPWQNYTIMMIYSVAAFNFNGSTYMLVSYVTGGRTGNSISPDRSPDNIRVALFKDFWPISNGANSFVDPIVTDFKTHTLSTLYYPSDDVYKQDHANINVQDAGYVYDAKTNQMNVFIANTAVSRRSNSSELIDEPFLFSLKLDMTNETSMINSFKTGNYLNYSIFNNSSTTGKHNRVRHGFFNNTALSKHGIKHANNSSFTFFGTTQDKNQDYWEQKIGATVSLKDLDPTPTNGNHWNHKELSVDWNTKSTNKIKIFRMTENGKHNSDKTKVYSDVFRHEELKYLNNVGGNFAFGFLAAEYNTDPNKSPFDIQLLHTRDGSNGFQFMSLKPTSEDYATYGYQTKVVAGQSSKDNPIVIEGVSDIRIDNVDYNFLVDKLEISKRLSSKYLWNLKIEYFNEISKFVLDKNINLVSSKNNGVVDIIQVKLLATHVYDKDGVVRRIENPQDLTSDQKVSFELVDLWISGFIPVSTNLPQELEIKQEWLSSFIDPNNPPFSGTTKNLKISQTKESELIKKIIDNRVVVGPQNGIVPKVWIEYNLKGDQGWYTREAFENHIAQKTTTAISNEIKFRFKVDTELSPDGKKYYSIDEQERILHREDLLHNAAIKIYVQEDYEHLAKNVSVSEFDNELMYNYGSLPVDQQGNWTGQEGLKIQWTNDNTANYSDPISSQKWSDTQIKTIDGGRYLAIRIVPKTDAYIYSSADSSIANIHRLDIHTGIPTKVQVNSEDLKLLNLMGNSNYINIDLLKKSESTIKYKYGANDTKIDIKYKLFDPNGNSLSGQDWIFAEEINTYLDKYTKNYENPHRGIIRFGNNHVDIKGFKLKATFVAKYNNIDLEDPKNPDGLKNGIEPNTDKIITIFDLSDWVNILKTVPVNIKEGSTPSDIKGISLPDMKPVTGQGPLFGMSLEQLNELMKYLNVAMQFKAPGSKFANDWKNSLDEVKDLGASNELYTRFIIANSPVNNVFIVVNKNGSLEDNSRPTEIRLVVNSFENPIDQDKLKFLRVKQGGQADGDGTFSIYLNDPQGSNPTDFVQLEGFKFLVRVWNKDKKIKYDWAKYTGPITDLSNGDKVEWKLVTESGISLMDSYYNTIAKSSTIDKIEFIQINQKGFNNENVTEPILEIGKIPANPNEYPQNSGFEIFGLEHKPYTSISSEEFEQAMKIMDFKYQGENGKGNMISDQNVSNIKVKASDGKEFSLKYLLNNGYIRFYLNDSDKSFEWNQNKDEDGNIIMQPGNLSNGDKIVVRYTDSINSYQWEAPEVSFLKENTPTSGSSAKSVAGIAIGSLTAASLPGAGYLVIRKIRPKK